MAWSPKLFACPLALAMAGTISTMTLTAPRIAHGETRLVPSLAVSERYDSNVFFIPGRNLEDYVTNISPQMMVDHKGRLIDGTVRGGATGEVYVKNPGLNYVAANGGITLNLDNAVAQLVRGAGLKLADTFYFTPTLKANVTAGMTVIEPSDRVQYLGTASVEGKLQNTDASLSYSRGVYPSFFISGLPLLSQVVTATVSHRLTALLTVTVNGNYAKNESVPAGTLSYESYGATVGLNYTVSRILNASLSYTNSEYKTHSSGLNARFDRNMVMVMLTAAWN